jgi:cytoskeletal protein CcmA (bactofilin family)
MVLFAKEAQSHNDRIVASTQEEIRRLARNGNGSQPEAASSISSGLSIVGKIIGHGALTIFGRVEGEVRASNVVIAEGAQIVGDVVAEELTVGGHLKGTIRANRVKVNSTAVVEGDIFHRTLMIEENARFEGTSRRNENPIETPSPVQINWKQTRVSSVVRGPAVALAGLAPLSLIWRWEGAAVRVPDNLPTPTNSFVIFVVLCLFIFGAMAFIKLRERRERKRLEK